MEGGMCYCGDAQAEKQTLKTLESLLRGLPWPRLEMCLWMVVLGSYKFWLRFLSLSLVMLFFPLCLSFPLPWELRCLMSKLGSVIENQNLLWISWSEGCQCNCCPRVPSGTWWPTAGEVRWLVCELGRCSKEGEKRRIFQEAWHSNICHRRSRVWNHVVWDGVHSVLWPSSRCLQLVI